MMKQLCFLSLLFLTACAASRGEFSPPHYALEDQFLAKNYTRHVVQTGSFDSVFFERVQPNPAVIKVVIEGDGYAWKSRHVPSEDPTPRVTSPVAEYALEAASSDNVVYVARPCQLTHGNEWRNCTSEVWTRERFDENSLTHFKAVLAAIKTQYPGAKIALFGYSGGGVVAAMLAASAPRDVCFLGTMAAPMDTSAWTKFHDITPVNTAYSSELLVENIRDVMQAHLVGSRDLVVPKRVVEPFWNQFDPARVSFEVVSGATHTKGWLEAAQALLKRADAHCS